MSSQSISFIGNTIRSFPHDFSSLPRFPPRCLRFNPTIASHPLPLPSSPRQTSHPNPFHPSRPVCPTLNLFLALYPFAYPSFPPSPDSCHPSVRSFVLPPTRATVNSIVASGDRRPRSMRDRCSGKARTRSYSGSIRAVPAKVASPPAAFGGRADRVCPQWIRTIEKEPEVWY